MEVGGVGEQVILQMLRNAITGPPAPAHRPTPATADSTSTPGGCSAIQVVGAMHGAFSSVSGH